MKLLTLFTICSFLAYPQQPQPQPDPRQRVKAVQNLAKQGIDSIPAISDYLSDSDVSVRVEAIKALDDIGGPKTLDPLLRAAKDTDPEMQIRAEDGLVNIYLPGYLKTSLSPTLKRSGREIRGSLSSTNDQLVDAFVDVPAEVIQALDGLLTGGASPDIRANSARALGVLRARATIPDLTKALYSKDDQLMYESLIALQKIADPAAGPGLAFLVRDLHEKIQIAALQTVGVLRTKEAAPQVRTALERANSPRIRHEAVQALAMIGDPADHALFLKYLTEKDDDLRAAAAEGLGRIRNPDDADRMKKLFESEHSMNTRLASAFASVAEGNLEMSEYSALRYLLNTLNSKINRQIAIAYLTELAREMPVRDAIYPILKSASRDEKTGICIVLGRSGDKDSQPYLESLLRDTDTDVEQGSILALRTLRARLQ